MRGGCDGDCFHSNKTKETVKGKGTDYVPFQV